MSWPFFSSGISKSGAWWLVANVCGISAWLYFASTLWPSQPYEHCDFAPGDPFVFLLMVVPLFGLAALAQLVALAFAIRRGIRTKRWTVLALVVITMSGWAAAAAYDYYRGQRIVTEDCPLPSAE